jgi:hypothetical protein
VVGKGCESEREEQYLSNNQYDKLNNFMKNGENMECMNIINVNNVVEKICKDIYNANYLKTSMREVRKCIK